MGKIELEEVKWDGYYPVLQDGHLMCTCGRPLNKLENGWYTCGMVNYKIEDSDLRVDKFGDLSLKVKDHG